MNELIKDGKIKYVGCLRRQGRQLDAPMQFVHLPVFRWSGHSTRVNWKTKLSRYVPSSE